MRILASLEVTPAKLAETSQVDSGSLRAIHAGFPCNGAYWITFQEMGGMKHQIAMFKFTLGNDQSIGPAALQDLWERCCGTSNVSVGRHAESFGGRRVTYSLYAPQHLPNLDQVELRLRRMFEEGNLSASVTPLHRM